MSAFLGWHGRSASPDVVELHPPPPRRGVSPLYCDLAVGAKLVRLFDASKRDARALTFRLNGPRKRFDHHRGEGPDRSPVDDPDRAVYYAAWSDDLLEALSCCVVEVFGDTTIVETGEFHVAISSVVRQLRLLDLRDRGAMRAGTVAAIAKCEHQQSQPWSRYFYEHPLEYEVIDGLIYRNAHNDEPAVMLYERAQTALMCPDDAIVRLDHPALRPALIEIMRQNNLTF